MLPARALFTSLLAASALVSADAVATPFPVAIRNYASSDVAIEVAAGVVAPCDSSANRLLFSGTVRAGEGLDLGSDDATVCVRTKFLDERLPEWSDPHFYTPRRRCFGGGRYRRCITEDPTIHVDLRR